MRLSEHRSLVLICLYLIGTQLGSCVTEPAVKPSRTEDGSNVTTRCNPQLINNDPNRVVCVCHENIDCHGDLDFEWPSETGQFNVISSSISGKRFASSQITQLLDDSHHVEIHNIDINTEEKAQKIMGWGGAFTDATCYLISELNDTLSDKLVDSLFGSTGLKYNFGRVTIAGSDFSLRPYTYDDTNNDVPDYKLNEWSLAQEDLEYKIPVIQKSILSAKHNLNLFASPWSPPKWMKTNKNIIRGHLIDSDEVYSSYAEYLVRFFDVYRQQGIEFWGATVQNEPTSAYFPFYFFNSLQFSAKDISKFIANYYGPALEASNRTRDNFKLMIGDDSLGFVNAQVPSVMNDKAASKYISGLAFHWYTSGLVVSYDKLNELYEQIKDKIEFVMMSEACTGSSPLNRGPSLGDWSRGESYAYDIIQDLNRYTSAWIDWNMVLDLKGGPNWAGNFVDSPIILDVKKQIFYKQPMYYVLAHFSLLFPAGCRVVKPNHGLIDIIPGLSYIACHIESSNHISLNVLNHSKKPIHISISLNSKAKINHIELERKSLTSILIKL